MAKLRSNVNFGNSPGRPPAPLKSRYVVNGLRLLVEDVERPVEIVDEEAAAARLVAQVVDARQLRARVVVRVVRGDRQRGVVLRAPAPAAASAARRRVAAARASDERADRDAEPSSR